jgi:hypothetical protein
VLGAFWVLHVCWVFCWLLLLLLLLALITTGMMFTSPLVISRVLLQGESFRE